MHASLLLFVPLISILPFSEASGQCSDGGICSIGAPGDDAAPFIFEGSFDVGRSSDDDLIFLDLSLGFSARLFESVRLRTSLPFRRIDGPSGTVSGVGDLLTIVSIPIFSDDTFSGRIDAGVRIPSGAVNVDALPQAYQPGLGTTDLLFGVSVVSGKFNGSLGYQLSPGTSDNVVNQLRRGNDASLRVGYTITEDLPRVSAELLFIRKLTKIYAVPTSAPGTLPIDIPDSDRLQANLIGTVTHALTEEVSLIVQAAFALLARPVNLDGLKRNFSLSVGVAIPVE
jgi:hypothetical protein